MEASFIFNVFSREACSELLQAWEKEDKEFDEAVQSWMKAHRSDKAFT